MNVGVAVAIDLWRTFPRPLAAPVHRKARDPVTGVPAFAFSGLAIRMAATRTMDLANAPISGIPRAVGAVKCEGYNPLQTRGDMLILHAVPLEGLNDYARYSPGTFRVTFHRQFILFVRPTG